MSRLPTLVLGSVRRQRRRGAEGAGGRKEGGEGGLEIQRKTTTPYLGYGEEDSLKPRRCGDDTAAHAKSIFCCSISLMYASMASSFEVPSTVFHASHFERA